MWRYALGMGKPATRDVLLEQIRDLPLEDRDYIEAELARDGDEAGRRAEDPDLLVEVIRRANDALAQPSSGLSREESVARARTHAEAVRKRNP